MLYSCYETTRMFKVCVYGSKLECVHAFYYSYIYVLLSVPWAELEIFKTNETEYQFTRRWQNLEISYKVENFWYKLTRLVTVTSDTKKRKIYWPCSPQWGSNSRPLVYKTSALTTELWRRTHVKEKLICF